MISVLFIEKPCSMFVKVLCFNSVVFVRSKIAEQMCLMRGETVGYESYSFSQTIDKTQRFDASFTSKYSSNCYKKVLENTHLAGICSLID